MAEAQHLVTYPPVYNRQEGHECWRYSDVVLSEQYCSGIVVSE